MASGDFSEQGAKCGLMSRWNEVLRGATYIANAISKDALNCLRWERKRLVDHQEELTERQRDVLQLLAEGRVMKEIGSILNMSTRTVAFHKYRMMHLLGFKNGTELVRYAVQRHMVQ